MEQLSNIDLEDRAVCTYIGAILISTSFIGNTSVPSEFQKIMPRVFLKSHGNPSVWVPTESQKTSLKKCTES